MVMTEEIASGTKAAAETASATASTASPSPREETTSGEATISRAQIQWLMDWAGRQLNKKRLWRSCAVALFGASARDLARGETAQVARARCTEAFRALPADVRMQAG